MNYNSNQIGYLLNKASQMLRADLTLKLREYDLTAQQWSVLKDIEVQEKKNAGIHNFTPAAIAERLNADRPTISGILDRLLKKGLIETSPNPHDRRSFVVQLTSTSKNMLPNLEHLSNQTIVKAIHTISENEQKVFIATLVKIIDNLH